MRRHHQRGHIADDLVGTIRHLADELDQTQRLLTAAVLDRDAARHERDRLRRGERHVGE
jgi:hypothetical protein